MDKALRELLPEHSRSIIQQWIKQGLVLVNGKIIQPGYKLDGTEHLALTLPAPAVQPDHWSAQNMDLDIIDEDEHLIVINKPAGLVVHPGAGNEGGTLVNGLLHHHPALASLQRAGIVHRLDKNTGGLMVVAKTELARQRLVEQLSSRKMSRQYLALINGIMISGETIDQPVGRHAGHRLRMSVTPSGKPAITHIRVLEKYRSHCLIQAALGTGRTHQIRIHLSWKGHPIVGDKLYGNRGRPPPSASQALINALQNFQRQALHAQKLSLVHPFSGEQKTWQQPPPDDFSNLAKLLQEDAACG